MDNWSLRHNGQLASYDSATDLQSGGEEEKASSSGKGAPCPICLLQLSCSERLFAAACGYLCHLTCIQRVSSKQSAPRSTSFRCPICFACHPLAHCVPPPNAPQRTGGGETAGKPRRGSHVQAPRDAGCPRTWGGVGTCLSQSFSERQQGPLQTIREHQETLSEPTYSLRYVDYPSFPSSSGIAEPLQPPRGHVDLVARAFLDDNPPKQQPAYSMPPLPKSKPYKQPGGLRRTSSLDKDAKLGCQTERLIPECFLTMSSSTPAVFASEIKPNLTFHLQRSLRSVSPERPGKSMENKQPSIKVRSVSDSEEYHKPRIRASESASRRPRDQRSVPEARLFEDARRQLTAVGKPAVGQGPQMKAHNSSHREKLNRSTSEIRLGSSLPIRRETRETDSVSEEKKSSARAEAEKAAALVSARLADFYRITSRPIGRSEIRPRALVGADSEMIRPPAGRLQRTQSM